METAFEVYRDGKPDPDYKRKVIIKRTQKAITAAFDAIMGKVQDTVDQWRTEAEIEAYDRKHGTNLKDEYIAQKKAQAVYYGRKQFLV